MIKFNPTAHIRKKSTKELIDAENGLGDHANDLGYFFKELHDE